MPSFPAVHFGAGKRAAMHQASYIRLSMSTLSLGLTVEHPLFISSKHWRAAPHNRALCTNATCAGLSTEPCRDPPGVCTPGRAPGDCTSSSAKPLLPSVLSLLAMSLVTSLGLGFFESGPGISDRLKIDLKRPSRPPDAWARARPRCHITDQGGCNTKDVVLLSLAELHQCAWKQGSSVFSADACALPGLAQAGSLPHTGNRAKPTHMSLASGVPYSRRS